MFDAIHHGFLLENMSELGLVVGSVLCWRCSFLSDRFQWVAWGDSCSSPCPLAFGVHGFLFLMKPLCEFIRVFVVGCPQYEDDAVLYWISRWSVEPLNCYGKFAGWLAVSKVKLNSKNYVSWI